MFMRLLISTANASNHTECVSLSKKKKCNTPPSCANLYPNEYSEEFNYYSFAVKSDRCVGSRNTLNGLSDNVCTPNNTQDLNLSMFNMTTGINELKTLTKRISCKCKCKIGGKKCNLDQWRNIHKC